MLATVYLLVTSLAGFAAATRVIPWAPAIVRVPAGFLLAIVFTSWTTYLIAAGLSGATDASLTIGIVVSTLLGAGVLAKWGRGLRPRHLKIAPFEGVFTLAALALSWWLMHARLRTEDGQLVVSANTWGDFGLHIGLARSFSVGANYPPEYPFFAGEPIRYHFGFDFFAGMLQKGGWSVLSSFNVPGVLGFTSMLLLTFATGRLLFSRAEPPRWWRDRGVWAGLLAAIFVATNQSLGWLRYLKADGHGNLGTALSPSTWWHHETYLTGGPYTGDRIVMFNTLNVYLTQTHLIIAMSVVLLLTYVIIGLLRDGARLDRRVLAAVGGTFGASFWLNGVVWIAAAIFLGGMLAIWALVDLRGRRKAGATAAPGDGAPTSDAARPAAEPAAEPSAVSEPSAASEPGPEPAEPTGSPRTAWLMILVAFAVPALLLGVPQAIMLNGGGTQGGLGIHLGYLVCNSSQAACAGGQMNPLSLADWGAFVTYWWLNQGLFMPLLMLALIIGSPRDRKIIAATTLIFLWGSVFHVGADVGGQNHKVFNLWENLSGLFVAYAIVRIWIAGGQWLRRGAARKAVGVGARFVAVAATFMLVVSGLIDFMTVKNDFVVSVFGDKPQQDTTNWIVKETKPHARFLTDYDQLYTAPTMAGRGIALGYSSWASAAGYDIEPRKAAINAIYSAPDQAAVCDGLRKLGMDYVIVGPQERTSPRFQLNAYLFAQMREAATFGVAEGQYFVYRASDNC